MLKYVVKRLFLAVPTLIILTFFVSALIRLAPGGVVGALLADSPRASPELIAQYRDQLGLDRPIYTQYFVWMGRVLRGDLGESLWTGRAILTEIKQRFPATLELLILATLIKLAVGIPIGIYSAFRQDTVIDYAARFFSILFLAIPSFWLATIAIVVPSLLWNWAPPFAYKSFTEAPLQNLQQFWMPAVIVGVGSAAVVMRMTRSQMLEVLRQDYMRTAWSKGLSTRTVLVRHGLKNAMLPVLTIIGITMAGAVGGSVIMEQIFAIPGMGRYAVQSISRFDYPVIQAFALLIGTSFVVINLIVDLSYAWLDPRIKYG